MEESFWINKWNKNEIGFHKPVVHPFLENHFTPFIRSTDKDVFIPLCGKSIDMRYLADLDLKVVGSEFSDKAILAFYKENNLDFNHRGHIYSSQKIELIQGDFFKLNLEPFDLIYDRASLIAIDPKMRTQYWNKIRSLMHEGSLYFLILLQSEESIKKGPPFSVNSEQVYEFWGQYKVRIIHQEKTIPPPIHADSDQESWTETGYIIEL